MALESNTLLLPPLLARELGTPAALVLQQIHYWLSKSKHVRAGVRWIYNTYSHWAEQFPFSRRTVQRAVARLKELGLVIVERLEACDRNQTNWYSIDYDRLKALYDERVPNCPGSDRQDGTVQEDKMTPCLNTETTAKTASEKGKKEVPQPKRTNQRYFREWFRWASAARLVVAQLNDETVITSDITYRDWRELAEEYPLERLKQMSDRNYGG